MHKLVAHHILLFKECHFVRCIRSNSTQEEDQFDKNLVKTQLKTSSTIAYAEFMRSGYPSHVGFETFLNIYKPVVELLKNMCAEPNYFVIKCLLSLGLKFKDFRIGTEYIFLQSKKIVVLNQLFLSDEQAVQSSILKAKTYVLLCKFRCWINCIRFLIKCRYNS